MLAPSLSFSAKPLVMYVRMRASGLEHQDGPMAEVVR